MKEKEEFKDRMDVLKKQAWILLSLCAIAYGAWHRDFFAGAFFFFLILLIGNVLTGWTEWLLQRIEK